MNDFININSDSLIDGCYHEIGHILSTILCFPDETDIVYGFVFERTSRFGLGFNTNINPDSLQFLFDHVDLFAIMCLSGGVFQQMHRLNKNNAYKLSIDNLSQSFELLHGMVKANIDGMQADYSLLEQAISYNNR